MLKELNPLLHSQLRLSIMSLLLTVEEAEFVYLKEKTQADPATSLINASDKSRKSECPVGQAERSRICFRRKKFCRKETAYALSDYIGRAGSDG